MGLHTGIEWTDASWNPWQGCHKIRAGCRNCYMFREKRKYGQDPETVVRSKPATFDAPMKWAKQEKLRPGSTIFVCSWSDFWIEEADPWRAEALWIMELTPEYTYLVPTKRIERAEQRCDLIHLPNNVRLGISVSEQRDLDESWPILESLGRRYGRDVIWISAEPLLEVIDFDLCSEFDDADGWSRGVDWIVAGCETGSGPPGTPGRPCPDGALPAARDYCRTHAIPFFLKQAVVAGRVVKMPKLDGVVYDQCPER